MKIAYIGNFTQRHCTEVHLAATLEDLGHEVVRMQENELKPYWTYNISDDTDLVLYTRTWGQYVSLYDLVQLRERKIPTASYHLDLYVGLSRKYLHGNQTLDDVLQTDPFWRTDFVFTPDGDPKSQEIFERNGVNHIYMKPGVYKPECYLADVVYRHKDTGLEYQLKKNDVLFVGGGEEPGHPDAYGHPEWNYRNELISWLRKTYGERFTKFGHPQETIRNEELNELYANTKIVIGDSVCLDNFTHTYYWSDRVYETIGRGGFIIHPYIKGMEEEFLDTHNIVFYQYGNWEQLKFLIDYYLEHDEEREKIRRNGHEFVKNHATYHNRLSQMLAILEAAGVVAHSTPAPTPEWVEVGSTSTMEPIKINLGSGNDPKEGHVNVDMLERNDVDVVHNLMNFPYPFEDNSASHIKAIDVIEHLDHYTDDKKPAIMEFMRECHRILQDGGELYIQTPSWDSDLFKIDITHVRGFHEQSFDFFDKDTWYGQIRGFYDGPEFKVSCNKLENGNLQFTMIKR